ncbi:hypothetical protein [Endozoicomonas sp. 8E]|uniref:hypothetical protein n=1 Tax=Endozoicomonas sp. 8E TaxID=3035692 RepID=UPI0029394689|nr:hypothetical protein [Endozoicomonas sp. 8E]WOG27204.1 hypothetical protein P6910_22060 [Endozoicomonas sp. 8E]
MTHHQNHNARCPPGFVIPEKAGIHRWRWIPAFAGMTTSEHGNELLELRDTLALRGNATFTEKQTLQREIGMGSHAGTHRT